MSLIQKENVDFSFSDERGALVQLVHGGFEQINILRSHKGTLRGGHYHRISRERFYVIQGCVELTATLGDISEKNVFCTGEYFEIGQNIVHSMFFLEETVMVALYDRCVEKADGTKDIVPV